MEQLARTVDMSGLYQQIYRNTSESLHCGRTIREGLVRTSTGALVLSPLRNFARLPDAALTGGGLGFIGIEAVIDYWMPPRTKELGEWYRREVRPLMNRLEELKRQVG
jgi:hypothetical protein